MTTVQRTVARGAILVMTVLAASTLGAGSRSGLPSSSAAYPPAQPASCVAAIVPEAYYQAIAELEACTGRGVAVESPPASILWAVGGRLQPPGPDGRVIVDP